jgi:outer membrane protein OmpU
MKKTLLSSSAIAGAALLAVPVATPAFAGTAEVGDSFTVTISGGYRFSVLVYEQDNRPRGNGQGYRFLSDEAEVKFAAGGVADNGLEYGFEMELNLQTDDAGGNADETWAYLRGNWGEINLGDQDDAADRMAIGGEDAMPGRGGYDGAVGDAFNFSGESHFNANGATFTGDSTKITYFTPRFFGFQLGASWTPDSTSDGGAGGNSDADTGELDVGSLGINYAEDFNGFGVIVAATAVYSDKQEVLGIDVGERWQYQAGLLLSYAGFQLGAAYGADERGINATTDEEAWWADVGLNYSTGPWKFGGGAFYSETELAGGDNTVTIYSIGANYQVAPGMAVASDVNYVEEDAAVAADNEGTVFVFSTIFSF